MRIKNSKFWVGYSLTQSVVYSLLLLGMAFVTRMLLHPYIEPYAPFHFFIVACLFIAYFFGYKLALIGVFISALVGNYFFIRPYVQFGAISTTDLIQFFTFALVAVIAIYVIEQLQRTVYGRNMVVKIMKSRHKISLQRENDRLYFAKKQNQSWAILEGILTNFDEIVLIKYGAANVRLEPLFLELAQSPKHVLAQDEWLTLVHADDAAQLQATLDANHAPSPHHLSLRFSRDANQIAHAVMVESNLFMNKTLKIVRLAKEVAHA